MSGPRFIWCLFCTVGWAALGCKMALALWPSDGLLAASAAAAVFFVIISIWEDEAHD